MAVVTALAVLVPVGVNTWGQVNQQTETISTQLHHPVTRLEVSVGDGAATIRPGRPGQVGIHGAVTWGLFKPVVRLAWTGDTLRITLACGPLAPGLLGDVLDSGCWGVQLTVTVPAGVPVDAAATAGTVGARQMTGPLTMRATSGSVLLTSDSGPVWARATSGAITATALTSARVNTALTSGGMSLQFARAPRLVNAAVTSGAATITVPAGSRYRVRSSVGSGGFRSVAAGLASASAPGLIGLSVDSEGSVTVGYPG